MNSSEEVRKPNIILKALSALCGAVVGTLMVRFLLLDEGQVEQWKAAWQGVFSAESVQLGVVLGSQMFWICAMGAVIGAGVAAYAYGLFAGHAAPRSPSEVRAARERARLILGLLATTAVFALGSVMAFVFFSTMMAIGVAVGLLILLVVLGLLFA